MGAGVVPSVAGSYAACATAAADLDLAVRARAWHGPHLAAHPGLFAFVGQVNDDAAECGSAGGTDLTARAATVRDAEPRATALVTRLAGELPSRGGCCSGSGSCCSGSHSARRTPPRWVTARP